MSESLTVRKRFVRPFRARGNTSSTPDIRKPLEGRAFWPTAQVSRCWAKTSGRPKKHRVDYGGQRRNVHLGIDATTLEIRAIEVTDHVTGDALMLSCLVDQIPSTRPSQAPAAMVSATSKAVMKR